MGSKKKEALLLHTAANILEDRGWIQGVLRAGPNGPYCTVGAMFEAREELFDDCDRFNVGVSALSALADDVAKDVSHWNDEKGRTKEQVVSQIRATANRLSAPWYK